MSIGNQDTTCEQVTHVTGISLATTATVSHDPIGTVVEEKITVSLNRDGSVEQLEIKGNLYVNVNDPESGRCRLKLRSSGANGISFQVCC